MRGAVLYGREDVRLESVPVPQPGPGEVLVHIERAATCGTDLKVFHRGGHARMLKPPTLFGHEFSGVVAAVGPGVSNFHAGQRVACHNSAPCGRCFYCVRERLSLCENLLFLNGAFAEFICVPEPIVRQNLLALPDGVCFEEACLMEPLSCVLHGVDRTGVRPGDWVAVNGDGAIGQMFVWVLALRGIRVILTGGNDHRLAVGNGLGAEYVLNYRKVADEAQAVRVLAHNGRGVDAAIECTGQPKVWEITLGMLRKGGIANLFGGCPSGTSFSVGTEAVHYNEIEVRGVFHSTPSHVREALGLIARHPGRLRPLLSCELPLSELHEAFRLMDDRKAFKVVIHPETA
ncbi:MAG: alcohol dehydrogenase catalytic domain-containing protein [Planctomycetes bacterium]|nr:alcohol dehydrogenase catalytic domain-containing protein [Planctomycetota bacterium]